MRQRVALAREKLLPILGLAQIGGDRGGPQDREGATRAEERVDRGWLARWRPVR